MAKRGRKAEPRQAPRPNAYLPVRPPTRLTGRARVFWKTYAPALFRVGLLTELDIPAFIRRCQLEQELEEVMKEARGKRKYQKAPSGYEQVSPAHVARQQLLKEIRELDAKFGMTPADRTKIDIADQLPEDRPEARDKMDDLFLKRGNWRKKRGTG